MIKEIESRKDRSNMLFDTSEYSSSSALMTEENYDEDDAVNEIMIFFIFLNKFI